MDGRAENSEVKTATNVLENAVDKEHTYRTVEVRLAQIGNPNIKYVDIEGLSQTIAERMSDVPPDVAVNLVVNMAKNRSMRLGELMTLAAAINDGLYGDGISTLEQLDPLKKQEVNRLMNTDPGFDPGLADKIKAVASRVSMDPTEILRRYGTQQARSAAESHEKGREVLREEILSDVRGDQPPGAARVERKSKIERAKLQSESDAAREQIQAERDRLRNAATEGGQAIETPPLPTKESLAAELAGTMEINWQDIAPEERDRLLGLDETQLYVELARMSPQGRAGADELHRLEKEQQEALNQIEKQRLAMEAEHEQEKKRLADEIDQQQVNIREQAAKKFKALEEKLQQELDELQ